MKYLLMVLFALLPFVGATGSSVSEGEKIELQNNIGYNEQFVEDLDHAILYADFSGIEKYLADTVRTHSESTDQIGKFSKEEAVDFFNYVFGSTYPESYELEIFGVGDDIIIYKLTYFLFVPDSNGDPKLSLAIFAFSEHNGVIDVILIP